MRILAAHLMKAALLLALMSALSLQWVAAVRAEPAAGVAKELKLSTALGPAYPQGRAAQIWARLIRERSAGRLVVTHFPGATLTARDPGRELAALRSGSIDLAVGSTIGWSTDAPDLSLLALPWLVPDEVALDTLLRAPLMSTLAQRLDATGVVAVHWSANGFVAVAGTRPLRAPADFAGVKVRAPVAPLLVETLTALGASSVPDALRTGDELVRADVDAVEVTLATLRASHAMLSGFTHVQLWSAHADCLLFAVNRAVWDDWSAADRELVRRAAQDAGTQARALLQQTENDAAIGELQRQGTQITRLTAAGKLAFRRAVQPVYDRWTVLVGADLVLAAQAAVAAPGK